MARTKHHREKKRQLGQFLTPPEIAAAVLSHVTLGPGDRVLEPGFGDGAFLIPLIDRFLRLRDGALDRVLTENVWGIELDESCFCRTLEAIRQNFGELPKHHNLVQGDFLLQSYPTSEQCSSVDSSFFAREGHFDHIVGNPPFGGTVNLENQNDLERQFGRRYGLKIKKESYSYFIVKALDLLRAEGKIHFICSDTLLTIPTMKGLRNALMSEGSCEVEKLERFSDETSYPMIVLRFARGKQKGNVVVNHSPVPSLEINRTHNLSWNAGGRFARYFGRAHIGDFFVASSGMTTGKNEYFVREIVDDSVLEPYDFSYFDDPICLDQELRRARLGQLSQRLRQEIAGREARGETRRNIRIVRRTSPERVSLPHPDYRFYNKAQPGILWTPPRYAIFWKDDGDAVITFKKNGPWYLHGVGGAPYFGCEGITWRLVSARIDARYLGEGYILDSGAPCAFLRQGVQSDELWYVLGWLVTDAATAILKAVLNHTMNIQSKDIERLPYPWWVSAENKQQAIRLVRRLVERAQTGEDVARDYGEVHRLQRLYNFDDQSHIDPSVCDASDESAWRQESVEIA